MASPTPNNQRAPTNQSPSTGSVDCSTNTTQPQRPRRKPRKPKANIVGGRKPPKNMAKAQKEKILGQGDMWGVRLFPGGFDPQAGGDFAASVIDFNGGESYAMSLPDALSGKPKVPEDLVPFPKSKFITPPGRGVPVPNEASSARNPHLAVPILSNTWDFGQLLPPPRTPSFSPSPGLSEQGSASSVDSYFPINPGNVNVNNYDNSLPVNYAEGMVPPPYLYPPSNDCVLPQAPYQTVFPDPSTAHNDQCSRPRVVIPYPQNLWSILPSNTPSSENLPAQFDQLKLASQDESGVLSPTAGSHNTGASSMALHQGFDYFQLE